MKATYMSKCRRHANLRWVCGESLAQRVGRGPMAVPAGVLIAALLSCSVAAANPPPRMPPAFDEQTVRGLVARIEQDRNDAILKFGYFLRRARHPLPAADGMAIFAAAIAEEAKGSRRWFLLQSVRGFGGLRAGPETKDDAYTAYAEMLDRAADAHQVGAAKVVLRSIYEFSGTVPEDWTGRGKDARARELLPKALSVYLDYLRKGVPTPLEIPWGPAIAAAGAAGVCAPLAEAALADQAMPRSYDLLRTAAACHLAHNRDRAIELLLQAKPLLPKDDSMRVRSFFDALVTTAAGKGQTDVALEAQREQMKMTGQGWGQLAILCFEKGDEKGFQEVMFALEAPGANEREINEAANRIFRLHGQEKWRYAPAAKRAAEVLTKYLARQRPPDVEQGLRARLYLGRYYLGEKMLEEATAILAAPSPEPSRATPVVRALSEAIQALREQIQATTRRTGG